jgi:hypothetical protein
MTSQPLPAFDAKSSDELFLEPATTVDQLEPCPSRIWPAQRTLFSWSNPFVSQLDAVLFRVGPLYALATWVGGPIGMEG